MQFVNETMEKRWGEVQELVNTDPRFKMQSKLVRLADRFTAMVENDLKDGKNFEDIWLDDLKEVDVEHTTGIDWFFLIVMLHDVWVHGYRITALLDEMMGLYMDMRKIPPSKRLLNNNPDIYWGHVKWQ